jgi:hypothetical protein
MTDITDELTVTEEVLASEDLCLETKIVLLRAFMDAADCLECADEAHDALHWLEAGASAGFVLTVVGEAALDGTEL